MQKCLENANFEDNILHTTGRTFKLEDLARILLNTKEKLNIVYNKYFYGFEKEGKSSYFLEKSSTGQFIPFRYPLKEDLLPSTLMKALHVPIKDIQFLLSKPIEEEKDEKNKENMFEGLTREEKRKLEKDIKNQKKIEADLEPERILNEEISAEKARVPPSTHMVLERMRGFVLVEGKEEEQDFELICNFNELTLKPMKNQQNRLSPE
eukprot:CAMPEP_0202961792 /NCGR_PEP_ID=MMETSP1396-20130829/5874_1 /ASSEMBLY_ACC=CAM_ASM_000872 /TAXON_ID= /ORGANISM="Pseudokeronopsis sp., Strain Brazil" /LENGTH=207 /DNA_ID=CAMNT_0049681889 /DNA_START=471 /DNA_END=1094 /DNA_ORIENTATION=-